MKNERLASVGYQSHPGEDARKLVAELVAPPSRTACSSQMAGIFNTSAALLRTPTGSPQVRFLRSGALDLQ